MASRRPHFSTSGPELQKVFEANKRDPKVLRELLTELKHRSTPTAQALRREVEAALGMVKQSGGDNAATRRSNQPPSPPPPTQQTLTCRGCNAALRVPIRAERTAYSCPTCKADFETVYKDGVLQVVWVEAKSSTKKSSPAMTEALAREILGVTLDAGFAAIKAAWRKASQQYHPDKHQGLPERLRRAAEVEMKRINEAYRYLEGSTATDF